MFRWLQPKWRHPDAAIRVKATRRSSDQRVLAQLAETDPSHEVRKAAVERLKDGRLLGAIAASDADLGVRRCAIERVNDPAILALIAAQAESGAPKRILKDIAQLMFDALIATDASALLEASVLVGQAEDSALSQLHLSFLALAALVFVEGSTDRTQVLTQRLKMVVLTYLAGYPPDNPHRSQMPIRAPSSRCLSMIATPRRRW